MVGCAAIACKNSSWKGVKVNSIPRDINRARIWLKNAGLDETKINKHAVLCEYHFAAEMWEKPRVDGKKKLKYFAVPTIFGDLVTQIKYGTVSENLTCPIPALIEDQPREIITVCKDPMKKEIEIINHIKDLKPNNSSNSLIKRLEKNNIPVDAKTIADAPVVEKNLSISENQYKLVIVKQSEYIERLERQLQRSERLRDNMRKNHKRLQKKYHHQIGMLKLHLTNSMVCRLIKSR